VDDDRRPRALAFVAPLHRRSISINYTPNSIKFEMRAPCKHIYLCTMQFPVYSESDGVCELRCARECARAFGTVCRSRPSPRLSRARPRARCSSRARASAANMVGNAKARRGKRSGKDTGRSYGQGGRKAAKAKVWIQKSILKGTQQDGVNATGKPLWNARSRVHVEERPCEGARRTACLPAAAARCPAVCAPRMHAPHCTLLLACTAALLALPSSIRVQVRASST
jgi:hypothetical protein